MRGSGRWYVSTFCPMTKNERLPSVDQAVSRRDARGDDSLRNRTPLPTNVSISQPLNLSKIKLVMTTP